MIAKKEEFGFQMFTQDDFAQFLLSILPPEDQTNCGENASENFSTTLSSIKIKVWPWHLKFCEARGKRYGNLVDFYSLLFTTIQNFAPLAAACCMYLLNWKANSMPYDNLRSF